MLKNYGKKNFLTIFKTSKIMFALVFELKKPINLKKIEKYQGKFFEIFFSKYNQHHSHFQT